MCAVTPTFLLFVSIFFQASHCSHLSIFSFLLLLTFLCVLKRLHGCCCTCGCDDGRDDGRDDGGGDGGGDGDGGDDGISFSTDVADDGTVALMLADDSALADFVLYDDGTVVLVLDDDGVVTVLLLYDDDAAIASFLLDDGTVALVLDDDDAVDSFAWDDGFVIALVDIFAGDGKQPSLLPRNKTHETFNNI